MNTKKYLNGYLAKHDASVKQLQNYTNKIPKHMMSLKKHNKMLFKLEKETSSLRKLNKIRNTRKASCDSSMKGMTVSSLSIHIQDNPISHPSVTYNNRNLDEVN